MCTGSKECPTFSNPLTEISFAGYICWLFIHYYGVKKWLFNGSECKNDIILVDYYGNVRSMMGF